MRRFAIALAALASLFLTARPAAGQIEPAPPLKHNVLVFVLDDLGTEKLDFYGQSASYPPTPQLDKLRQSGVLFANAYVNPLCSPTRTCVQTGRYAFRTGMGTNGNYS